MTEWFSDTIVDTGRLPLFAFFVSVIVGFLVARATTRLIRASARWSPRNVTVGDVHVHHAVLGVALMLLGGVLGLAVPVDLAGWRTVAAAVFGLGTAAVLDEFALILRLRDVYWTAEGRLSVDAVFVVIAITGLVLLGVRPAGLDDFLDAASKGTAMRWILAVALTLINLSLAITTILKGKIATAVFGMFFWPLLVVGAARLARPRSPWARCLYYRSAPQAAQKLTRATKRDEHVHRPIRRAVTRATELIAGRPDSPYERNTK